MSFISESTYWTILMIVHGLLAVTLLGALTHQALAIAWPVRQPATPGFVKRFRSVPAPAYATAVVVLWIITFLFGAYIYIKYRTYIRVPLERGGFWKTVGFFEMKEHAVTLGLGLLPIYWWLWKNAKEVATDGARGWITIVLAALCWFSFLVGHVLNNTRGFGS